MGSHALDNQNANGDRLITELSQLKQQMRQLRTLQSQGNQALNIGSIADSIAMDVAAGEREFYEIPVNSNSGGILMPSGLIYSLYEDEFDDSKLIGGGNPRDAHWRWDARLDWGHTSVQHDNVVVFCWVENNDTIDHTVTFAWELRVIVGDPVLGETDTTP